MTDNLDLRSLVRGIQLRWWLPSLMAVIGAAVGLVAALSVTPVYRAQATVLVGPTNGAVTHSATIRTSEDLAVFYADMARRQILLQPVVDELRLNGTWFDLRDRISAVVPDQNPRLVTVTVMGDTQADSDRIANALVRRLVTLSPSLAGGNTQAFINEQADNLKATIEETQREVDALKARASATADPETRRALEQKVVDSEDRLTEWRGAYVDLIGAEPTSDAGGLQVLDEAAPVTDMGRSGTSRQALLGGFIGAALGLLGAGLMHRRATHGGNEPNHARTGAQPNPPDGRRQNRETPRQQVDRSETGAEPGQRHRGSPGVGPHRGPRPETAGRVHAPELNGK